MKKGNIITKLLFLLGVSGNNNERVSRKNTRVDCKDISKDLEKMGIKNDLAQDRSASKYTIKMLRPTHVAMTFKTKMNKKKKILQVYHSCLPKVYSRKHCL